MIRFECIHDVAQHLGWAELATRAKNARIERHELSQQDRARVAVLKDLSTIDDVRGC